MNYLAKIKDKIGTVQGAKIADADPFEPFEGSGGGRNRWFNVQPVVVNKPKNAPMVLSSKRFKSHSAYGAQSVAVSDQTVAVSDLNAALEVFKQARPDGTSRFRHDQAYWVAEMFLNEWESLAVAFEWTAEDIFDRSGLAYWLGTEIVTALGPEQAVTESRRVFDRITRLTWVNPYDLN